MANTVEVVVNVRDNASGGLGRITGALSNMASVAGGILAADVLSRIGEGLFGLAQSGFDGARGIENATARLNAFTKDADVSAAILADLRDEAAKTPFAFQDMADAATSLLPVANSLDMELMDLIRTAEVLAATNPAEGLEGAAFALREAASGDFTSIIERFNLSRSAINALKEEGVPNLEIISRAMADMGYDMDLVSNLSTTFDGRMSTLKDNIGILATAFATPIFSMISNNLGIALGDLEANLPALKEAAGKAGQFIADIPTTIQEAWAGEWVDSDVIQPLHRLAGTLTQDVKGAWDGFNEVVGKAKGLWNDPWVQEQIIQPLSQLDDMLVNEFQTAWNSAVELWGELNEAGEAWNGLMEAGQGLWNTLVGSAQSLGTFLGFAAEKGETNNQSMKTATDIGGTLIQVFDGMAKVAGLASVGVNLITTGLGVLIGKIYDAIGAWRELVATLANAPLTMQAAGEAAGEAAINAVTGGNQPPKSGGGTAKGMLTLPTLAPVPAYEGGGAAGGGMGRAATGDTMIFHVYNQLDIEEVARKVQKYKAERG